MSTQNAAATAPNEDTPQTTEEITSAIQDINDPSALMAMLESSESKAVLGDDEEPVEEEVEEQVVEEEETEETEEETSEEEETTEVETEEETEEEEEVEEEKLPRNFRFQAKDPAKQRFFMLLKQEPGANIIDLAKRAGYELPETPGAKPEPKPEEPKVDPFQSQRDEIASLQEQLKEANENSEFEEISRLTIELADKKADLKIAEAEQKFMARTEQELSKQQYQAEFKKHEATVLAKYPNIAKPGSAQHSLVAAEVAHLERTDPEAFNSPDYVLKVIANVEKKHPAVFHSKKPTTVTKAAKPTAKAKRPVGEVVPAESGVQQSTKQQAMKQLQSASLDDLMGLAQQMT